jgi:hypothetical protein
MCRNAMEKLSWNGMKKGQVNIYDEDRMEEVTKSGVNICYSILTNYAD